ncbi:MAG: DUF6338 family protein [Phycisphaerales bacterium]
MEFLSDPTALSLALRVLVPGFVMVFVYDLFVPGERRNPSEQIIAVFAYGSLNLSLGFWIFDLAEVAGDASRACYMAVTFLGLFAFPTVLALIAQAAIRSTWFVGLGALHPTPTGWDYFLGQGKPCWMLFHFKSGELAGGKYSKGSFCSSHPCPRDVYVTETWRVSVDGKFEQRLDGTAGMWVSVEECHLIEFFEIGGD